MPTIQENILIKSGKRTEMEKTKEKFRLTGKELAARAAKFAVPGPGTPVHLQDKYIYRLHSNDVL